MTDFRIRAGILAAKQLDELAQLKSYELRIEYSQNGKVISDELFKQVSFFYTPAEGQAAIVAALALVEEHGNGSAAVYCAPAEARAQRHYLATMNAARRHHVK
jgi:hypothetical protein